MSEGRILVIDDDPLILKLLQTTIERAGFEVLTASDGQEGIEAIRGEHPDLVISDVMMPRVDGFELVRLLRSDRLVANTPLIILSAKGEEEDRVKGLELGADDYITKPFSPRELVARVKALLRRKSEIREKIEPVAQAPFAVEGLKHLADFRFDNFIVGAGNRSAYEAAKAVAEAPGTRFNPLFIFGGPGLGKTHLMCAVANEMHRLYPNATIKYVTSEVMSQHILEAHEHRKVDELKKSYTSLDLLMLDDIQFLAISPSLQLVTAEMLYEMVERGKQILITSDRRPEALETLTAEMTSGFALGLVVEIDKPDATLRSKILKFKAHERGWDISDEILEYLAHRLDTDIRSIEGAARRLVALKEFAGVKPTKASVDELIASMFKAEGVAPPPPPPPPPQVQAQPEPQEMGLAREFGRPVPITRVLGSPDDVAKAFPPGASPVVVLGPSASLVMDTVEALVGRRDQAPRIPEGGQWAYMVHVEGTAAEWVVVGTTSWVPGSALAQAIAALPKPRFLVVLDSMSPRVMEARGLVSSLPPGVPVVVVVMVSVGDEGVQVARETLSKSLRRLFRIPDEIPLIVSGGISTAQCRSWLRAAQE